MSTIDDLANRIERLVLRYEELRRTHALALDQIQQLTAERDSLKSRLSAARHRIDALLDRIPATPDAGNPLMTVAVPVALDLPEVQPAAQGLGPSAEAERPADWVTDLAADLATDPVTVPVTEPGLEVSALHDASSGEAHSASGQALADSGAAEVEAEEETEAPVEAPAIAPAHPDQAPALEVLAPSLPIQALQQSTLLLEPGLSLSSEPASAGLPPVTPVEHA